MPPAIQKSPRLQDALNELLQLPAEERLELGECLLASVSDEEIDRAWDEELARRIALLESGAAKTIPASEVMAEMRKLVDEAR